MAAIMCSVGITAYQPYQKQNLRQLVQENMPGPVYNGHWYSTTFYLDDELILMNKEENGRVVIHLCSDSTDHLYPL